MNSIKSLIKKYIPLLYKFLANIKNIITKFAKKSYSQFGEDIVLSSFFAKNSTGFFIDIGAYHPHKFSNTYFFYKKGWRGINIDAKPGSMAIFKKKRPKDINLETGISNNIGYSDFYIFSESAYNTFSKKLADSYIKQGLELNKKVRVKTDRLENILDRHLPTQTSIDFISVDVEGLDLEVLKSNNWDKYKPHYIMSEMHNIDIINIDKSEIYKYLTSKKYKLISVVNITLIFKYESTI